MDAIDAVREAFTSTLAAETYRRGQLVTLPMATSSGHLVQVYVEQVTDDLWFVSDEGQTAAELALSGVNLGTQKNAAASWQQLIRSVPISAPLLVQDVGEFDIAGLSSTELLGQSMLAVAEGAVRGEGLKALARGFRAKRFRDVIIQSANRRNLPVLLDAPMPTKHGGTRPVSVQVSGRRLTYMQAVSGAGAAIDGYDKAQGVFSSANVERESLVAVLADRVRLAPWQWETLRDSGIPITESQLEAFMEGLAS